MNKAEAQKAYNAGKASLSIVWPDDAADDQRRPGMHHCPFALDDPQRQSWRKSRMN